MTICVYLEDDAGNVADQATIEDFPDDAAAVECFENLKSYIASEYSDEPDDDDDE